MRETSPLCGGQRCPHLPGLLLGFSDSKCDPVLFIGLTHGGTPSATPDGHQERWTSKAAFSSCRAQLASESKELERPSASQLSIPLLVSFCITLSMININDNQHPGQLCAFCLCLQGLYTPALFTAYIWDIL